MFFWQIPAGRAYMYNADHTGMFFSVTKVMNRVVENQTYPLVISSRDALVYFAS
jgi:hypothetical protein